MKKDNGIHHEKEPNVEPAQAGPEAQCQAQPRTESEEFQALWAKYVRACADFDNARKRWDREREEALKFGNVGILRELIVTLDEMAHAVTMVKAHNASAEIVKGLEMMYNNFFSTLKKRGLSVIETQGKKFDPHFHEIVATREMDNVEDPTIIEEVQRGYLLEDKVLRASKVIVGVKPQAKEDSQQSIDRSPQKKEEESQSGGDSGAKKENKDGRS